MQVLFGRERELRPVAAVLDEARRGRSGTLTIVGDPGVGKTALLEEATRLARDMRLVSCAGVESESELPFASLHELLRPLLELLPQIPDAQARAVSCALRLEDGEADTLALGAGTLSLLAEAAEERPLLLVIDDAHWLDRGSGDAIAFAARRLRSERVAVLVAQRFGASTSFDSFPRLELGPLEPDAARRLLATRSEAVPLGDEARVLAAAAGNPLVLLELPVALTHELPSAVSPGETLRRAFSHRLDALSDASRRGLLLAAAEPDSRAVRDAAGQLGLDATLAEAERAGLVRLVDGAVSFRHPVVRSLVYAGASLADRAAVHGALADALAGDEDRDRRAWHLAASLDTPDERVASLLDETAERAAARGGHAAEARALARAAALSASPGDRAQRLLRASRAEYWAGDARKARELAEAGLTIADDPLVHADLLQQMGAVADWDGDKLTEIELLQELERVRSLDPERGAKLMMLVVNQRMERFEAEGAAALAPQLEELAAGAGMWWGPRALATAAGARLMAGQRDRARALFGELVAEPAIPAGFASDYMHLELWDEVRASLAETLREGRASGNLLRIVWNQSCSADLELRHGRLRSAEAAAVEAAQLGELLGVPGMVYMATAALAGVQAWRGDAEACSTNGRATAAAARANGDRYYEGLAMQALARLALGLGRPEEAPALLEPLAQVWAASSVAEPGLVPYVPDLVEAYAATGRDSEGEALLARFAPIAEAAGTVWARAVCARCDALLARDAFDTRFLEALELLEPSPYALELARTQLAYGERLRRARRRRDARPLLRAAYEAFAHAGAMPWQNRAAAELRATGEHAAAASEALPELTSQELYIAGLVAQGMTNKEIGAAIYLSPRTVQYHLASVFRKLNIHTRSELARIVTLGSAAAPS